MTKQCINYNIPPELPCCGVAVLCHVLDKNFKYVFLDVKETFNKGDDWYGGMSLPQVLLTLIDHGIDFEEVKKNSQTLYEFTKNAKGEYIINTPLHFQYFKDGNLYDQTGTTTSELSEKKHEKITNIVKIL